jgi:hypothetical protein
MTTIASTRRSDYGMSCIQCCDVLIAPEWSEYVNERSVHHLWRCTKCGCSFETSIQLSPDYEALPKRKVRENFFPLLLVA